MLNVTRFVTISDKHISGFIANITPLNLSGLFSYQQISKQIPRIMMCSANGNLNVIILTVLVKTNGFGLIKYKTADLRFEIVHALSLGLEFDGKYSTACSLCFAHYDFPNKEKFIYL